MSIFKRLENHYKSKSYLTYHAANEHEQLLLFYPNYKSTKIYVIHKWVKTYKERKERLIQLQEEEYELQANVIDDAHALGFVEGVRYALNIMDMTDAGKNKELLERLLNILEREVDVNGKKG